MRQKMISTLMALVMALSLLPVPVLAAGSGVSTPSGTPLTQELIESKRGYTKDEGIQLPAGDYYLTGNVYLVGDDAGAWSLLLSSSGNFTLDLNGYVLDLRGANICAYRNLTLKDSSTGGQPHKFRVEESGLWVWDETNGTETVTGGVITGGVGVTTEEGSFGGGVYVGDAGFTMKNGSIVGCTASFGGGVYMMGGDNSTFTMEGGHIVGCTAGKTGGGVDVGNKSANLSTTKFTMKDGSIEDCTAANGGGVYTQSNTKFTMEGGSIQNCTAIETGGGVYGASTFTMTNGSIQNCAATNGGGVFVGAANTSTMEGGSIRNCTAANGGGVYVGDAGFTMTDGSIEDCTATQAGGGVFVVNERTNRFTMTSGSIKNCKAGGAPNAVHADGTFDNRTGIEKSLLSGINGGQTGAEDDPILIGSAEGLKDFQDKVNGGRTALCARLLCDIVLNDGTFAADGSYTSGASGGIAKEWTPIGTSAAPYSGTFDGDGYTIKGLYVKGGAAPVENAGLFGCTADATIKNAAVTGYVSGTTSGGIVGTAQGGTAIQNCANTGYVNGTTSGGIVGSAGNSTVSSCLNTGAVTGTTNAGGIVGRNNGGSIASSFYLTGKAANVAGENTGGTVTSAEAKTKTQFANELLPLLQNGDTSLWTRYGYNRSLNMTLPLLKGQTADAHTHVGAAWLSDSANHWKECACGVIYDKDAHSGGTATCTAKAQCAVCGTEYGQPTGHSWGAWTSNGNDTHTRHCTIEGCSGVSTASCSGGTATCAAKAQCAVCGGAYGQPEPANHTALQHVAAKKATRRVAGNIEYWRCEGCARYYADVNATMEITQASTVIGRLQGGNSAAADTPVTSAQTGDDSRLALWCVLLTGGAAVLAGMAAVRRRRRRIDG